jgi:hypothetical protein
MTPPANTAPVRSSERRELTMNNPLQACTQFSGGAFLRHAWAPPVYELARPGAAM